MTDQPQPQPRKTRRPGRPKGAKTTPRVAIPVTKPACPHCHSTDRTPYDRSLPIRHLKIRRKYCHCRNCGAPLIHDEPLT